MYSDMWSEALIISIHVPRAGDDAIAAIQTIMNTISIHVPRAGDDVI